MSKEVRLSTRQMHRYNDSQVEATGWDEGHNGVNDEPATGAALIDVPTSDGEGAGAWGDEVGGVA